MKLVSESSVLLKRENNQPFVLILHISQTKRTVKTLAKNIYEIVRSPIGLDYFFMKKKGL
jgi:hypothetical protein